MNQCVLTQRQIILLILNFRSLKEPKHLMKQNHILHLAKLDRQVLQNLNSSQVTYSRKKVSAIYKLLNTKSLAVKYHLGSNRKKASKTRRKKVKVTSLKVVAWKKQNRASHVIAQPYSHRLKIRLRFNLPMMGLKLQKKV